MRFNLCHQVSWQELMDPKLKVGFIFLGKKLSLWDCVGKKLINGGIFAAFNLFGMGDVQYQLRFGLYIGPGLCF